MESIKHIQLAKRKLINIQTYVKNMHQNTKETKLLLLKYIAS